MTTTTVPSSVPASRSTHPVRLALVALVLVVLFAATFVIGRVSVATSHAPAPLGGSGVTQTTCKMGRPC
jgi:hypothetical protein